MAASARWSGAGSHFELKDDGDHTAASDEGPPLGVGDGMSPANLLLAALCACTGITAVSLLKKMKQPLKGLTFSAEGDWQPVWRTAFTDSGLGCSISRGRAFEGAVIGQ